VDDSSIIGNSIFVAFRVFLVLCILAGCVYIFRVIFFVFNKDRDIEDVKLDADEWIFFPIAFFISVVIGVAVAWWNSDPIGHELQLYETKRRVVEWVQGTAPKKTYVCTLSDSRRTIVVFTDEPPSEGMVESETGELVNASQILSCKVELSESE